MPVAGDSSSSWEALPGAKLATANEQMERGEFFDAPKTYLARYTTN